MKKIAITTLLITLSLTLFACKDNEVKHNEHNGDRPINKEVSNEKDTKNKDSKTAEDENQQKEKKSNTSYVQPVFKIKSPIDLNDVKFKIEEAQYSGEEALMFSYVNNTDFAISDVELRFTVKQNLSYDDLKVFDEIRKNNNLSNDAVKDLVVLAYNRSLAEDNSPTLATPSIYEMSYNYVKTMAELDAMELSEVKLQYAGKDKMLHTLIYNIKENTCQENQDLKKPIFEFDNKKVSGIVPKPDVKILNTYDYGEADHGFGFIASGVKRADFEKYIEKCKQNGFTKSYEKVGSIVKIANADGFMIDLTFSELDSFMSCDIHKQFTELNFDNIILMKFLPELPSKIGEIKGNEPYVMTLLIAETSPSDFKAYIKKLKKYGYNKKQSESETEFTAVSDNGYELTLKYIDKELKVMQVRLSALENKDL